MYIGESRPQITLEEGAHCDEIRHNGSRTSVSFTKDKLSIGCTDISVEAAKWIMERYNEALPKEEKRTVIIQSVK